MIVQCICTLRRNSFVGGINIAAFHAAAATAARWITSLFIGSASICGRCEIQVLAADHRHSENDIINVIESGSEIV